MPARVHMPSLTRSPSIHKAFKQFMLFKLQSAERTETETETAENKNGLTAVLA